MPSVVHLLGRALVVALVGAAGGLAVNALRADGLPLGPFATATSCVAPASAPQVLPPAEAVRLCGDPGVLVADARPSERFAAGHVAGAIHLPCAASGSEANRAMAALGGKHTVVVYGDSTDEARPVADDLHRRLSRPGLRLVILDGGFPAWDRAGLACSSGPCPDCEQKKASRAR